MTTTKVCFRCSETQDITAFTKSKATCRDCAKKMYSDRRQAELTNNKTKTCIHCSTTGSPQNFVSLKSICKDCDKKKKNDRHLQSQQKMTLRICSHCSETKAFEDFKKGLSICRGCCNKAETARRSQWSHDKRQEEKQKNRDYYQRMAASVPDQIEVTDVRKKCTVCQEIKPMHDFYCHKKKGTIRSACKECTKEIKKQYYEDHKTEYIKKTDAYKKKRIQNDPAFHLERRMRCRVYTALTNRSVSKDRRTLEYLGCTADFFQKWIAFQLYDGMTMENYGEVWHVDHTKPIAKFDLTDENQRRQCFSWRNCRPLLATKNITKSDAYHHYDSVLQELKAHVFVTTIQPR